MCIFNSNVAKKYVNYNSMSIYNQNCTVSELHNTAVNIVNIVRVVKLLMHILIIENYSGFSQLQSHIFMYLLCYIPTYSPIRVLFRGWRGMALTIPGSLLAIP